MSTTAQQTALTASIFLSADIPTNPWTSRLGNWFTIHRIRKSTKRRLRILLPGIFWTSEDMAKEPATDPQAKSCIPLFCPGKRRPSKQEDSIYKKKRASKTGAPFFRLFARNWVPIIDDFFDINSDINFDIIFLLFFS